MRTFLSANQDFYLSALGSDSTGDGSSANPWKSIAHAYSYTQRNLDLAGQYVVTCYLKDTYTYSGVDFLKGPLVGSTGPESFLIRGLTADASRMFAGAINLQSNAQVQLQYVQAQPGNGNIVTVTDGVFEFGNINLNVFNSGVMMNCAGPRAKIKSIAPCTIVGVAACAYMFVAEDNSQIELGFSMSIAGAPQWFTAFCQADLGAQIDGTGFSYSGGFPTGRRYIAASFGKVWTGGTGNPNFFPGDSAGVATGGYYG